MAFVILGDSSTDDHTTYEIDTDEDREAAVSAMLEADVAELPVYVGDPESPDTHRNGQVLLADWRTPTRAQAIATAALFVEEWGVVLDPAETDWDGTAWEADRETIEQTVGGSLGDSAVAPAHAAAWELYSETLCAETSRLVAAGKALRGDLLRHRWGSPLQAERALAAAAVRSALATHGNVTAAAQALDVTRSMLVRWLDASAQLTEGLELAGPGRPAKTVFVIQFRGRLGWEDLAEAIEHPTRVAAEATLARYLETQRGTPDAEGEFRVVER
jgi:hypothetical protein